jgi:Haem-binding domain
MPFWKLLVEGIRWRWVILTSVGALMVIQLVPVGRTNPPVESDVAAPAPIATILRRACYDCHSNETVWSAPQSFVAPASWLVARDVREGRRELNFSRWASYSGQRLAHKTKAIQTRVSRGSMPPRLYLLAHPEAKLSDADRAALAAWASGLQIANATPAQN